MHTTLQEVLATSSSSLRHCSPVVRYGAKDLEAGFEVFFQVHNGSDVTAAIAVIGCGPDGDYIFVLEMVLPDISDCVK